MSGLLFSLPFPCPRIPAGERRESSRAASSWTASGPGWFNREIQGLTDGSNVRGRIVFKPSKGEG